MDRVQLIHWKAAESVERAERIRALGDTVDHQVPAGPGLPRELAADCPAAVVDRMAQAVVRRRFGPHAAAGA